MGATTNKEISVLRQREAYEGIFAISVPPGTTIPTTTGSLFFLRQCRKYDVVYAVYQLASSTNTLSKAHVAIAKQFDIASYKVGQLQPQKPLRCEMGE